MKTKTLKAVMFLKKHLGQMPAVTFLGLLVKILMNPVKLGHVLTCLVKNQMKSLKMVILINLAQIQIKNAIILLGLLHVTNPLKLKGEH